MATTPKTDLAGPTRPLGTPEIPQVFLPTSSKKGTYSPRLYGAATLQFRDRKRKIDEVRQVAFTVPLAPGVRTVDWEGAQATDVTPAQLLKEAPVNGPYLPCLGRDAAQDVHALGEEFRSVAREDSALRTTRGGAAAAPNTGHCR